MDGEEAISREETGTVTLASTIQSNPTPATEGKKIETAPAPDPGAQSGSPSIASKKVYQGNVDMGRVTFTTAVDQGITPANMPLSTPSTF